jgi:polyisoprenoid-binding protein YceI
LSIPAGTWNLDPNHSEVGFTVHHMGVSTYRGVFTDFDGTLEVADDGSVAVSGAVRVASAVTRTSDLDKHLQTPEFFDGENHPEITFRSSSFEPGKDGEFSVAGEITIRDTTKKLDLTGRFGGSSSDPWGNERIGVAFEGQLDRTTFDLNWNTDLPSGGVMVSNEVTLYANVQAIKAA